MINFIYFLVKPASLFSQNFYMLNKCNFNLFCCWQISARFFSFSTNINSDKKKKKWGMFFIFLETSGQTGDTLFILSIKIKNNRKKTIQNHRSLIGYAMMEIAAGRLTFPTRKWKLPAVFKTEILKIPTESLPFNYKLLI